jgi:uroporphyrinogen-III synthase
MNERPLAGLGVLVTRPQAQSAALTDAIESLGGTVHRFPVLDIVPRSRADVIADASALAPADMVIFVSTNAVLHGLHTVGADNVQIAAIGPATAAAITAAGTTVDILPVGGADSEHLLAAEAFKNVAGKTVTIVRGQSGREVLAESLRQRGATVQYLAAYERVARSFSQAELDALDSAWRNGDIDAVVIMSVATLDALLESLPPACLDRLPETPLVGPGKRVIQTALQRLPGVVCVQSPGPEAADMVAALMTVLHQDTDPEND